LTRGFEVLHFIISGKTLRHLDFHRIWYDNHIVMTPLERSQIPVIGIVGGIGSGKSAVSAELARLGCFVIDADAVGHELLETEEILNRVREAWGDAILSPDGSVDRAALGAIVFNDDDQLRRLEGILHPAMGAEIRARVAVAGAGESPAAVIDAAVLFEAGWDEMCSHTIFVDSPEEERFQRVSARSGWSREMFDARESSQIPLDKKAERCCYTLRNDSDMSRLSESTQLIFHRIVNNS